jgi:diacylglycerol kinase (ATP)
LAIAASRRNPIDKEERMNKIRIIHNPTAGKGNADKALPMVEDELKQQGVEYDLVRTESPWHAARLAEEAVVLGYEAVAAAGGDGTANEVLNGIMQARKGGLGQARLALLPIGRGNDFGFAAGIPHDIKKSVQILAAGKTIRMDIGEVRGGLYPNGRYFGNGIGIGFDAVGGFIAAKSKLTGFPGYLAAAMKTMVSYFNAPLLEITLDDETLTWPCLMVSIMNGRRMGGGFMMAPGASNDDGIFDLCLATQMSRLSILRIIPTFFNGSQGRFKQIHFRRSTSIRVKALSGTLPVHADGETICVAGEQLSVRMHPKAIEIFSEGVPEA